MRRILIRGANWIGDSVMSIAALRELRRLSPDSHLVLLVKSWVADLFKDQGLVDEIITIENNGSRLSRIWHLPRRLRDFDAAVLFQNAFEAAAIAFRARIPERIGYGTDSRRLFLTRQARPRIKQLGRHQVFYYLDLLYQTGLSPIDYLNDMQWQPDIRLCASQAGLSEAGSLLSESAQGGSRRLVIVNPGAYFGSAKRWFLDRYADLADRLIESEGAEVAIIGSLNESRIADEIQKLMKNRAHIFTGRTTLAGLMGLLSWCDLFITNDSGPMHLAAAVDVPQIAIFGSTDEQATGPLSRKAVVIHKHVECSPCLLRECPIDLRCFRRIGVDEVYETARRLLRNA